MEVSSRFVGFYIPLLFQPAVCGEWIQTPFVLFVPPHTHTHTCLSVDLTGPEEAVCDWQLVGIRWSCCWRFLRANGASERHLEWRPHSEMESDTATDVTVKPWSDLLSAHMRTHTHIILIISINDSRVSLAPCVRQKTHRHVCQRLECVQTAAWQHLCMWEY